MEKAIKAPAICRSCGRLERYWPGVWQLMTITGNTASSHSYFVGQPAFTRCARCDSPEVTMLAREDIATFRMGGLYAVLANLGLPHDATRYTYAEADWPEGATPKPTPGSGFAIIEPG